MSFVLIGCSLIVFSAHANIKIGTVFFYPPFIMSDGSGFDIDFTKMLCQGMQVKCDYIPMEYHQLFTALDSGKIDIAIGGITISSASQVDYIFSLPYKLSRAQFLVAENNTISSIKQLQGNTVGVIKGKEGGGDFYDYLNTHFVGQFTIKQYDDIEDIITALSNNDITAAFLHESTCQYWMQNGGNQFKIMGQPIAVGEGIAIMALPSKAPLIEKINQQILKEEQNNDYLNLYNTYFANET